MLITRRMMAKGLKNVPDLIFTQCLSKIQPRPWPPLQHQHQTVSPKLSMTTMHSAQASQWTTPHFQVELHMNLLLMIGVALPLDRVIQGQLSQVM
jgi:hypothetical protein